MSVLQGNVVMPTSVTSTTAMSADGVPVAPPFPVEPFHAFLGFREVTEGGATHYLMDFQNNHLGNPMLRTFHGGVLAAFGEVVAGMHLAKHLGEPRLRRCATMTFDYLRPAFAGTIVAIPNIVRSGRRISTVSVQIRLNDQLVCIGRFLYSVADGAASGKENKP